MRAVSLGSSVLCPCLQAQYEQIHELTRTVQLLQLQLNEIRERQDWFLLEKDEEIFQLKQLLPSCSKITYGKLVRRFVATGSNLGDFPAGRE